MKMSELTSGNYLSAAELEGRDVPVQLERIDFETMQHREGQGTEQKPVAYFLGKTKGLVLNKTNLRALEEMGLEDTDQIPANFPKLMLYTVETQKGPGLRLRVVTPGSDMSQVVTTYPVADPNPNRPMGIEESRAAAMEDDVPF